MVEIKQIGERTESLVVYREGDRVWEEEFPVTVYEDGETALAIDVARQWEKRHRHYLALAESGALPQPTSISPADESADGGVTWNLDEPVLRPLIVYHDGEHYWMEDFPVYLASDGDFLPSEATMDQWEERHRHYCELASTGQLPEPTTSFAEAAGARHG